MKLKTDLSQLRLQQSDLISKRTFNTVSQKIEAEYSIGKGHIRNFNPNLLRQGSNSRSVEPLPFEKVTIQ